MPGVSQPVQEDERGSVLPGGGDHHLTKQERGGGVGALASNALDTPRRCNYNILDVLADLLLTWFASFAALLIFPDLDLESLSPMQEEQKQKCDDNEAPTLREGHASSPSPSSQSPVPSGVLSSRLRAPDNPEKGSGHRLCLGLVLDGRSANLRLLAACGADRAAAAAEAAAGGGRVARSQKDDA